MDFLIVTKFIAIWLLPPGCIIALLVAGLVLWRRRRPIAFLLMVVATLTLYALSAGPVAQLLTAPLERFVALSADDPRLVERQAIVVLGGGRRSHAPEYGGETVSALTLERLRYGAHLQRVLGLPLAVTGGVVLTEGEAEAELMARSLHEDFGRTVRWIESRSRTTYENARNSRELLGADQVQRIILVSHAIHLPRATREFVRQGFDVLPAPTAFYTGSSKPHTFRDWMPSSSALSNSWYAIHEHLGRLWYWIRY
ncbi:MAG: uncharacterized SAM-binding protein YcdF (DUF218 family) [Gammaproteobacteria bacterium]|jgi:uncharacterized SAM-binding protein YcdF (DUF218 family)